MALNEDVIYRASSQYRLWSFSTDGLSKLRSKTNALAASRVRAAIQRSNGATGNIESSRKEIECLTVEEELKLVGYYCTKAMDLADLMHFPTTVKVRNLEPPWTRS
jgi:cyclin H